MKTVLAISLFLMSAPVLANTKCLTNEYGNKICVGDTLYPWNQKVVDLDEERGIAIIQERNIPHLTGSDINSIVARPREGQGYRVGQVLKNPAMSLQIIDLKYQAEFSPELLVGMTKEMRQLAVKPFEQSQVFWRAVPQVRDSLVQAMYTRAGKAEAYGFLVRDIGNVRIEQVEELESTLSDTATDLQTSFVPFEVKVVEINPQLPTLVVEFNLRGKTRRLTVAKSELDLYSKAQSASEFENGCMQISFCKSSASWGK